MIFSAFFSMRFLSYGLASIDRLIFGIFLAIIFLICLIYLISPKVDYDFPFIDKINLIGQHSKLFFVAVIVIFIIFTSTSTVVEQCVSTDGVATVEESNLTIFYNNDLSPYYAPASNIQLYYANCTVDGVVKVDLSDVEWNASFVPHNTSNKVYSNDVDYAKEHFLDDIKHASTYSEIVFYDENGNNVSLDNDELAGDDGVMIKLIKDSTLSNNILSLHVHVDKSHANEMNPVSNAEDYTGLLSVNQSDVNQITSADVKITLYTDNAYYIVHVKLDDDDINLVHT